MSICHVVIRSLVLSNPIKDFEVLLGPSGHFKVDNSAWMNQSTILLVYVSYFFSLCSEVQKYPAGLFTGFLCKVLNSASTNTTHATRTHITFHHYVRLNLTCEWGRGINKVLCHARKMYKDLMIIKAIVRFAYIKVVLCIYLHVTYRHSECRKYCRVGW